MSVRSRVAFASGGGAVVASLLLLSGRYEGSVVLVFLVVVAVRSAGLGVLVGAGPILATDAIRALRGRALLAPAWGFAVAAAVARNGSTAMLDVRGANAVVGPSLVSGPALTVVGCWLAFVAAVIAVVASSPAGAETAAPAGMVGRVVTPPAVGRLEALGVLAEAGLAVALFVGPQVVEVVDAVLWAAPIVVVAAIAWVGRRRLPPFPLGLPAVAAGTGLAGVVLVLLGGRP